MSAVEASVWERDRASWHLAFGVLALLTAVLTATDGDMGTPRRFVALGLLAALVAAYCVLGRPALRNPEHRGGIAYLATALPVTVGLFVAENVGALMLFSLYPCIWALLRTRAAMALTVLSVLCVTGVILGQSGLTRAELVAATGQAVGVLVVAFSLGGWITGLIEQSRRRAHLVAELEATRAELAAMSHEAGVRAERERLSAEIHDTLTQGFASISLLLSAAQNDPAGAAAHLAHAQQTARENLADARSLVAATTPPQLLADSLTDALTRLAERAADDAEVRFEAAGTPLPLPAASQVVLLRATQEALSNVRKHAEARSVAVTLTYAPGAVALDVRDDGRGFEPHAPTAGFGLDGLRRRVAQAGGALTVTSSPGAGTALRVELPVAS